MLYLPLKLHQDPLIHGKVTSHDSTQHKPWGCGKLQTLQIAKLLAFTLTC